MADVAPAAFAVGSLITSIPMHCGPPTMSPYNNSEHYCVRNRRGTARTLNIVRKVEEKSKKGERRRVLK